MKLSQQMLHEVTVRRIHRARPDLAGRHDLSTPAALLTVEAEIAAQAERCDTAAVCVIRRFEIGSWIRGTCAFAAGVGRDAATAWRGAFTRTIFLAGNPENLRHRFRFAHVSDDGLGAWTAPAGAAAQAPLRRLLRLFDAPRGWPARPELTVDVPGGPGDGRERIARDLYIATAGVSVADGLVSLNHLLVEAVLDGLVAPGDRLTVRHVPRLSGVREPFAALRTGADRAEPGRLRAYAGLTGELAHA